MSKPITESEKEWVDTEILMMLKNISVSQILNTTSFHCTTHEDCVEGEDGAEKLAFAAADVCLDETKKALRRLESQLRKAFGKKYRRMYEFIEPEPHDHPNT